MPRLIVNPGSPASWEIELRLGSNSLGRALTNHFQISDPSVSSSHCQIFIGDGLGQIKDLSSTNGTFVDGSPVQEAQLQHGQRIRLGDVEMIYYSEASGAIRIAGLPQGVSEPAARPQAGTAPPPHAMPAAAPGLGSLTPEQHCRFHPAMPSRWFCQKCRHHFCEACVATRHGGKFCRHCGAECSPVQVQFQTVVEKGFLERLPGAFVYPLRGAGVFIVIVGIVIVALLKLGQAMIQIGTIRMIGFGVVMEIFAGGYLFTYLQAIVHATTAEERELPDLPGISNFLEDVILPFFRLLALTLFCFGPALGVGIWIAAGHQPGAVGVFLGACALGFLYFPMAFLAVAILDSAPAANPLVVVPSIVKVPLEYLLVVVLLAVVLTVQWVGGIALATLFPESWTTHSMGELFAMVGSIALLSFLSLYLLVVAVHVLGLVYVTRKEKLGWMHQ